MPSNGLPGAFTPRRCNCCTAWGIKPFAARLVDGPAATFHDDDLESGAGAVDRGGQPGRAAACHEQVDHRSLASAAFSTLIRVISSAALSIVNARPP